MGPEELYDEVNISKASRMAMLQFTDENAGDTIVGMMSDHNQLEEEDDNGSN
jgi:hypothetical protein